MSEWYGNLMNRLAENKDRVQVIEVGTPLTEYLWSDRHAHEVIEVKDQKHITVRAYKAIHIGQPYSNEWRLESDPNGRTMKLKKRGKYWYRYSYTDVDDAGKEHQHWERINISIGVADYYYDYEF